MEHQMSENDNLSLYQLLTQFVMRSNKLLEENYFEEQNNIIKECSELLQELCSISSNLKPIGQHLNNLFEDIKIHGLHNNEEEVIEWRNVFAGSRTLLVKEVLQLLSQPYLLKMIQNHSGNDILETSKGVATAVDMLQSIHVEGKVIHHLKRKLMKDDMLIKIMRNDSTNHKDHLESTSSPEDSYRTAASAISTTTGIKECMVYQKAPKQLFHQNQLKNKEHMDMNTSNNDKKSGLVTSSYFASPPLPLLNTRKYISSWQKDFAEMKMPFSSSSSIVSSRNHDGLARKRMYWTFEEEELLVLGVEKYNVGNWKLILSDGGLENRTVRDLYDKWKNINKYGHLDAIKSRLRKKYKLKRSQSKR